jgi:hypothetical protein
VPTFLFVDANGDEVRRLVGEQPLEAIIDGREVAVGANCARDAQDAETAIPG